MNSEVINAKKISSIAIVWKEMNLLREKASPVVHIHSVLFPKEIQEKGGGFLGLPTGPFDIMVTDKFVSHSTAVAMERPFIGEEIWTLYWAYRAILGRVAIRTVQEVMNRNFKGWNIIGSSGVEDEHLKNISILALTEEVMNKEVMPLKLGAPNKIADLIENKILREMQKLLLGHEIEVLASERANQMLEFMQQQSLEDSLASKRPIGFGQ